MNYELLIVNCLLSCLDVLVNLVVHAALLVLALDLVEALQSLILLTESDVDLTSLQQTSGADGVVVGILSSLHEQISSFLVLAELSIAVALQSRCSGADHSVATAVELVQHVDSLLILLRSSVALSGIEACQVASLRVLELIDNSEEAHVGAVAVQSLVVVAVHESLFSGEDALVGTVVARSDVELMNEQSDDDDGEQATDAPKDCFLPAFLLVS